MATARSFGNYDLAAALADLIDNSIRAAAKKITISFEPEKSFDPVQYLTTQMSLAVREARI